MAHPVYLYSPGGAFIQAPDGRPLLAQAGYVGTADDGKAESAKKAKGTGTRAAAAPPTYKARG